MVDSNRGRITYGLRIARYFRVQRLKIAIYTHGIVIVDPLAEERPAIYQRNLCIADTTGLSSFVLPLLPLKLAKSREIPRKFKRIAVQGHPRSSALLPIESAYATSYYSLIVTLDISGTVSEILTHKARRALTRDRPHCPLTSRF